MGKRSFSKKVKYGRPLEFLLPTGLTVANLFEKAKQVCTLRLEKEGLELDIDSLKIVFKNGTPLLLSCSKSISEEKWFTEGHNTFRG